MKSSSGLANLILIPGVKQYLENKRIKLRFPWKRLKITDTTRSFSFIEKRFLVSFSSSSSGIGFLVSSNEIIVLAEMSSDLILSVLSLMSVFVVTKIRSEHLTSIHRIIVLSTLLSFLVWYSNRLLNVSLIKMIFFPFLLQSVTNSSIIFCTSCHFFVTENLDVERSIRFWRSVITTGFSLISSKNQ